MDNVDPSVLVEAYRQGGWWAVAAVAVTASVRLLRHDAVQRLLPDRYRWVHLPAIVQWGAIGLASVIASVLSAIAVGGDIGAAIVASVPVAIAAVGAHKASKATGHAMTRAQVRKQGSGYRPGKARMAVASILPIDARAIKAAQTVAGDAAPDH